MTNLDNGGLPERAQAIASHKSPQVEDVYGRTHDEVALYDVERIRI